MIIVTRYKRKNTGITANMSLVLDFFKNGTPKKNKLSFLKVC